MTSRATIAHFGSCDKRTNGPMDIDSGRALTLTSNHEWVSANCAREKGSTSPADANAKNDSSATGANTRTNVRSIATAVLKGNV